MSIFKSKGVARLGAQDSVRMYNRKWRILWLLRGVLVGCGVLSSLRKNVSQDLGQGYVLLLVEGKKIHDLPGGVPPKRGTQASHYSMLLFPRAKLGSGFGTVLGCHELLFVHDELCYHEYRTDQFHCQQHRGSNRRSLRYNSHAHMEKHL